jgi:hypothetical protein
VNSLPNFILSLRLATSIENQIHEEKPWESKSRTGIHPSKVQGK